MDSTAFIPPRCSADACRQGRDQCPCPESCQVPSDDGSVQMLGWLLLGAVVVFGLIGLGYVVAEVWP